MKKSIVWLAGVVGFCTAIALAYAATTKGELATMEKSRASCRSLGTWDIAYFYGPPGMAQYGPGYGCKQGIEMKSSIRHAICQ